MTGFRSLEKSSDTCIQYMMHTVHADALLTYTAGRTGHILYTCTVHVYNIWPVRPAV